MAVVVRGKALWLPPALLFASVVLLGSLAYAIANLDRGEETLPELPALGGAPGAAAPFGPSGDQVQLLWRVTIGVIFLAAVIAVIVARLTGEKLGKTVTIWELLGYAFGIGIIGGLVVFWPSVAAGLASLLRPGGILGPSPSGTNSDSGGLPTNAAFPIAVVVFMAVVMAVYLFALSSQTLPRLARLVRGNDPARSRRRLEAASAVRRTLLELGAGTDFRTAVMACYQRMCSLLAGRGVSRQEALTAREIEGLALVELGLSRASVDDLTGLFEEARYSVHEIGPAQRDRAVDCLSAIRRELEG